MPIHLGLALYLLALPLSASVVPAAAERALERLREKGAREGWSFDVGYDPVMELTTDEATGYVPSEESRNAEYLNPTPSRDLPSAWDWRSQADGLQPVKHQQKCGSCWAFGTVAALEAVILIRDGVLRTLSEQQLVSCNQHGWSCSGGNFAHRYHIGPLGAALESEFPYVAKDVKCKKPLTYVNQIEKWAFAGSPGRAPSVLQVKNAIYTYGPVAVTVAVSDSFKAYKSGIYNANDNQMTNHITNIVGWNDDGGYWIMRNSWGEGWGENGHMRIKYGTNAIAHQATFVVYKPACRPQPIAYAGETQTIVAGESVRLGGMATPGHTYRWSPADTLDNGNTAMPLASPTQDTEYTLRVSNGCGTAEKIVRVKVLSPPRQSMR